MKAPTQGRPPYRLAFCPRVEAERAAALPSDLRALFAAPELAELEALPERRLRDRLSGRLAAKRALAAHFRDECGWDAEPRELSIFNDADGRPVLRLPAGAPAEAPSFSIAHSDAGGVCAVAAPGRRVGADIESVVPRPAEVLAFVSRSDELGGATPADPEAQARVWTGKEAALKLLGLGLDADARDVRRSEDGAVAYSGTPEKAWRALGSPRVRVSFQRAETALIAVAYTGD